MEAAEAVTTQWGYDCACLHVFQRNAAAIALYRRRGYEIVDDVWDVGRRVGEAEGISWPRDYDDADAARVANGCASVS